MFVVSGPSGAGKGTLIKGALERIPDLAVAVSVTTRAKRPGEVMRGKANAELPRRHAQRAQHGGRQQGFGRGAGGP